MDILFLAAIVAAINFDATAETCNYFLQVFQDKKDGHYAHSLRKQGR